MKPELSPPSVGQERRQPVGQIRVDEPLDATLRDVGELGARHGKRVERERERLSVEVAVRNEQLVFDEHERIVSRRIDLHRHGSLDVVEEIA